MVERKLAETGQHTISWNLAWGTIVNPAGEFEPCSPIPPMMKLALVGPGNIARA